MFDPESFVEETVKKAKEVLQGEAIIGTSGGVDSSVAAVIVGKAIGDKLTCIHIDNGFMRRDESKQVVKAYEELGLNVVHVDASDQFYSAQLDVTEKPHLWKESVDGLENHRDLGRMIQRLSLPLEEIVDPEVKRLIIGETFIRVFEKEARKVDAKYLIQGTLAPDRIESGGGRRDRIKAHHNVGALPEKMELDLYEPNKELYKYQVRDVGSFLGLPPEINERQPFPGPGLAIRVIGQPNKENVEVVRKACHIVETEIEKAVKERKMTVPSQYLAAYFPNTRVVGVKGDLRDYKGVIAVRAVETNTFMDAKYSEIPHTVLGRISTRITNELSKSVTGVFYDISNKPPRTVEYE